MLIKIVFLPVFLFAISFGCTLSFSQPNILLIVSDDHGKDAGCYGNKIIRTPGIDALAADGILYKNAYSTVSSCSPSRSVILSGMYNHANGMYGLEHEHHHFQSFNSVKSLPVMLKELGYRTGRVGKFHVAPEAVYQFDEVMSAGAANDMASLARSPVEMAEKIDTFLSRDNSKPFFLYCAYDDPHRAFPFETYPEPNSFGNRQQGYPGIMEIKYDPEKVIVPSFLPDNLQVRKELAQYYQSVSRMDQGISRIMQVLKSKGLYENTLIVYISDNGIAFPGAKTTLYEPGINLPCIVKLPSNKFKGTKRDAFLSWVDITPTLLDFAGTDVKSYPQLQGRSFRKTVEKDNNAGWNEVYASHNLHEITMYYPMRMVRSGNYKLIWNIAHQLPFPFALDLVQSNTWRSAKDLLYYGRRKKNDLINRPAFELYNLEKDPDEINNLANLKTYGKILEELKSKLKAFQQKTKDPWIHKWNYE